MFTGGEAFPDSIMLVLRSFIYTFMMSGVVYAHKMTPMAYAILH